MRILFCILIFYKKLILPSVAVATALSYLEYTRTGKIPWSFFVVCYLVMTLFFHYLIYEKINPNDYYFYHNMGLSKLVLWGTTFFLSLIILLILAIVCATYM